MSHDQNNKDGRQFREALTFQTKNILHHYEGILLVKHLWQNQNYQLVLGGGWIDPLRLWLITLRLYPHVVSDPKEW